MITRYAHLSSFEDGIRPGKRVKRGELVAYSGNTGLSEGPHLHYEILVDGKPVDPLQYLIADISPEEYLLFRAVEQESDFSVCMSDTKEFCSQSSVQTPCLLLPPPHRHVYVIYPRPGNRGYLKLLSFLFF